MHAKIQNCEARRISPVHEHSDRSLYKDTMLGLKIFKNHLRSRVEINKMILSNHNFLMKKTFLN